MKRAVRLPLEIGITALFDLAYGVLLVPLGSAVLAVGLVLTWFLVKDGGDGDAAKLTAPIVIVGAGAAWYGARMLWRAWRARPADLIFEDERLRVEGGRLHTFALPYGQLVPTRIAVTSTKEEDNTVAGITAKWAGSDQVCRLVVHEHILAEADAADEIASMRELCAAIRCRAPGGLEVHAVEEARARAAADAAAAAADAARPKTRGQKKRERRRERGVALTAQYDAPEAPPTAGVITCGKCGGLAPPSAEPTVACPSCGAPVEMPADVRARVKAVADVAQGERVIAPAVDALLDQPGARSTTLLLALSLALIGGAWPLATWGFVHLHHVHRLTWLRGAALAVLPLLLIADGFFLSRARLVDRVALGTLVMGFGARPPATPGAPPCCRVCGAALADASTTVVRCAFCGADNLTGVDLRALAGRTRSAQGSLEAALAARRARRRTWRLRTLASLPLFAATIYVLVDVVR